MPEFLDTRTLFFIGAMNAFICAVMLVNSRRLHADSRAALVWGGLTEIVLGGSMLLISMRGVMPDWISIWLANTMGSVGAIVLYQCVRTLCKQPPMRHSLWIAIALVVSIQAWLGVGPEQHQTRLLLTSTLQGGTAMLSLPLLWTRRGKDAPVPLRWGLMLICMFAGMHVLRVWSVLNEGVRISAGGMVEGSLILLLIVTMFSLIPMAFALVVMGLINGRIAGDLRKLASTDGLTNVLTRRGFHERAGDFMENCWVRGRVASVLMLDLDHFKQINDRFGHASGDRVLKHFARMLRERLPKGSLVGRYGGEEFCVLLDCAKRGEAARIARSLCTVVRATPAIDGARQIALTVSIGVATRPIDGSSLKELLLVADRRVYFAKDAGRDQAIVDDELPTLIRASRQRRGMVPV